MKKLLLTGLVAVSTVFVNAGLMPEQIKAAKDIQVDFSHGIATLKKEKKSVFDGSFADSQKLDTEIAEIAYRVGFSFVSFAAYINAVVNSKTNVEIEDILIGLTQLYSSAVVFNATISKSEDIWMRAEAQTAFQQLSAQLPKDSYNPLELIVLSEYSVALGNAGVQDNNVSQITQKQLESAVSEVVAVTTDELYSRLVLAVAKNAGRTEITKQDKEAGLAIFVDFFESCVKHVSFEESQQPVAETKTVESKKTTNNKTGTGTKKAPNCPVHKKK